MIIYPPLIQNEKFEWTEMMMPGIKFNGHCILLIIDFHILCAMFVVVLYKRVLDACKLLNIPVVPE